MQRLFGLLLALVPALAYGGAQIYEPLSAAVQANLRNAVSDEASPRLVYPSEAEGPAWLAAMSQRLERRIPDTTTRLNLLKTVNYEASRAGLDPQVVLGLIQVESGFSKYAVSRAGARGYMQVMPFWVRLIGSRGQDLFHLRTNLRYGCTILRYYLDLERGDYFRALGRYNGSLGQPDYPVMVVRAWLENWRYSPTRTAQSRNLDVAGN